MPISINDVREILTNVTTQLLPDETIAQAIRLSQTRINNIKKDVAEIDDIESAQLMYAAYLAYQFELTRIVRQMGSLPLDARQTLAQLKETAKEFLDIVASNKKSLPLVGLARGVAERWSEYEETTEEDP